MKKKVIVTRRWPEAVELKLQEHYDVNLNHDDVPMTCAELREALATADAVLTTVTDKLDAGVFDIPTIKTGLIANYGVGYSHIDIHAAKKRNIQVSNTPDVLNECTADIAMSLLLAVARRVGEGEREVRSNQWSGWRPTHMTGTKVSGKTLGIVGYGRIGQAMAQRAHHGFNMDIIVFNRSSVAPARLDANHARQVESLEELAANSDFLSLHCPGGEANSGLISAEVLKKMRPGAYIINTARGEVIDEEALVNALTEKRLAGAALDVFINEPFINKRLIAAPNLVMLPHLGSATTETREAMGFRAVENLDLFFNGKALRDRVA